MSRIYRCGFIGKDVGKTMSNTKKMVKWGLLINDARVVITIKHSILSHKKVIWYGNEIIKETKQFLTGGFDYAWSKDKHIFKIVIKKSKSGYGYSLFVDDINFFDLPYFKDKDKMETEDIATRLKSGPIIPHVVSGEPGEEEEEEENENEVEENENEVEEEDTEENQFFSTCGDEDDLLDLDAEPEITRTISGERAEEEQEKAAQEEAKRKQRLEEYTANGLVNLDFGF